MSETFIIGIQPPPQIVASIQKLREEHRASYAGSQYPMHDPHITLYMNSFTSLDAVKEHIASVLKTNHPFQVQASGINAFPSDPVTGEQVWKLAIEDDEQLKLLRSQIIKALKPIQTKEHAQFMLDKAEYTPQQKQNIEQFGTPFSPKEFRFHATVFSAPRPGTKLDAAMPPQSFIVPEIVIFRHNGKHFEPAHSIPLAR